MRKITTGSAYNIITSRYNGPGRIYTKYSKYSIGIIETGSKNLALCISHRIQIKIKTNNETMNPK
jgi:hypothetical protein